MCVVVTGWVCGCLGGSALGHVKDCPLLWVVGCGAVVDLGGDSMVAWGERIVVGGWLWRGGAVWGFSDFFFLVAAILGVWKLVGFTVCFGRQWRGFGWQTAAVLEWWLSWRWLSWDRTVVDQRSLIITIGLVFDTKFDVGPQ